MRHQKECQAPTLWKYCRMGWLCWCFIQSLSLRIIFKIAIGPVVANPCGCMVLTSTPSGLPALMGREGLVLCTCFLICGDTDFPPAFLPQWGVSQSNEATEEKQSNPLLLTSSSKQLNTELLDDDILPVTIC